GKKPADLPARKRGNYTLWKEGEARTLFGEPPKELTAIEAMDNDLERQILKGSVACPGIVVGKVRKIGKPSDAAEMKNGEILVASMTTTDLTDAINMASGFVTDEGGISCHAAIIARELN
ncbi:MAG: PEP-utilizing enzyme, partial [Clostridia bacterium]|nr:PEP-utilizing enzyme [Clostridia bacterium]